MQFYNPRKWFWFIGADTSKVYSSEAGTYLPVNHPSYLAFAEYASATRIKTEAELVAVLAEQAPEIVVPSIGGLTAYAAAKRYEKEVGGTMVGDVAYPTDRETQSKLASAVLFAQVNPAITFKWKVSEGFFVDLDATSILAVATAVGTFVQQCFAEEATVVAAIQAGTVVTREQVDTAYA